MITDIFKDIWHNKISRILLITAISLIFIGLILGAKISIYNFFYRIFVGEVFFDPYTYGKGAYGFDENPAKSEKLLKKGIQKIVKVASDIYNLPYPENLFYENYDSEKSWENFSSEKTNELIYMLFHDMELFCVPFDVDTSNEIDNSRNLEKRYTVKRKSASDILQYAIKDDEFVNYANWLMQLDQDYFYIALQKKPDSLPVLNLRKGLLKAICKPQKISIELTRALEYHEYKTEKHIYSQNPEELPDMIADKSLQSLKQDHFYKILLRDQFRETYFITRNIAERLKQSYNYYILQQNEFYLQNYLNSLLELSRSSGVSHNKKIFSDLMAMKTDKLANDPSYLYALAEIGFRAQRYNDTKNFLDELSMHQINRTGSDFYRIKRLYFLIELLNAG